MNAVEVIARLHEHRAWANGNLLSAATALSDDQLRREFEIGQGSIWKSLVHMYAAEYVWLAALEGNDDPLLPGDVRGKLPGNQLGDGPIASLAELRAKWSDLEQRWLTFLANLTPERLDEVVYKVASSMGVRFGTRCCDVLLHVCTHAHYTAAQVVNMLRQCGVETSPATMLIAFARLPST